MTAGAIGKQLDHRRAEIAPRALRGPFRRGPHGEEVIAIDAQAREPVGDRLRRESRRVAPGDARIAGDRPLVVGDAQDRRRAVDGGEGQCLVKITLGRGAFADIGERDPVVALRVEAIIARREQDRQLTSLQGVFLVREDLVDHVDHGVAARHQPPHHTIGWKAHVVAPEHHRLCDADRLLAGRLHVEAGLALAMRSEHSVVERTGQQHRAQAAQQGRRIEPRVPGAYRLTIGIEHSDEPIGHVPHLGLRGADVRPAGLTRGSDGDMGEIGLLAGPGGRFGNVQTKLGSIGHGNLAGDDARERYASLCHSNSRLPFRL
ncbi:unnamed protein product [Rhizophagus irregularis]|uniref:Uncharacterized protein n=1 Tax=Rhizophagus irregularis TaxID=588596 RepID=A0A915ZV87_9GLOM|nr:unnamed protein product [Rhizophagus irregularis]